MVVRPPRIGWMHDGIEARSSEISGRGLFATVDLFAGLVVSRLGGRLVSDDALAALMEFSELYVDTVSVYLDANLVLEAGTQQHYGNHACDPNLWWVDPCSLATRRPVRSGDELLLDYGTVTDDPSFALPCSCDGPVCRGVVTGEDWRLPQLQDSYADHWVPVLRERIRSSA